MVMLKDDIFNTVTAITRLLFSRIRDIGFVGQLGHLGCPAGE